MSLLRALMDDPDAATPRQRIAGCVFLLVLALAAGIVPGH